MYDKPSRQLGDRDLSLEFLCKIWPVRDENKQPQRYARSAFPSCHDGAMIAEMRLFDMQRKHGQAQQGLQRSPRTLNKHIDSVHARFPRFVAHRGFFCSVLSAFMLMHPGRLPGQAPPDGRSRFSRGLRYFTRSLYSPRGT